MPALCSFFETGNERGCFYSSLKKIFPLLVNVYVYIFMILYPAGTENLRNKTVKESIS